MFADLSDNHHEIFEINYQVNDVRHSNYLLLGEDCWDTLVTTEI